MFIERIEAGESMSVASAAVGIQRASWLEVAGRYRTEGADGLKDHSSRAPHRTD